ncbi:MAG: bifunctional folylpolyglutamate synthase/dihydrofolate synthase, partial [Pyrinomonadaceae bacterium]
MQFAEAVRYLLSLGHETLAIKLGLKNTELLLQRLGSPEQSYFSVQIAGTNGKGSTAAMLAAICRAAGIKAGLYTSPHLSSITERIQTASKEISREKFAECTSKVRLAAEGLHAEGKIEALPTFFEQVTAIALLAFNEARVDLAILETGLGGRLDATTAAGAELVGITPIAMDHEEHLGKTITSIAAEKAAIIRPGVTAIIAQQADEVLEVILERSESCGVIPSVNECETRLEALSETGRPRVTFKTKADSYESVWLGMLGRHQVTNASVALRIAESLRDRGFQIPRQAIIEGLRATRHPARLELFEGEPRLLLDGAHNPSGARALREYLDEFVDGPITMVFGAMRDK